MNDLVISLDTSKDIPLYEQIYTYIKEDIKKGNLLCGQRLPSSRKLSMYLEVSRSTVELAYEQLVSEGYLETIPCKGYYVAEIEELYQFTNAFESRENIPEEYALDDSKKVVQYLYDFSPNGIDLGSFPYNAWRKISKGVLSNEENKLFTLGDSRGEYEFRQTICQYLHQARGMKCSPEQVVIGAGNEYLLMLLSTIMGQQSKIAFENPTYERAYQVFKNLSHQVFCVNMDKYGVRVDELNKLDVQMAYVMPSHQFPTGVVMPIKRRLELLKWAAEDKARYIIEDDYDSEFRYKGKPIPALQGYDTNDKVIYLGTFSKAIAPAIRMSYMVLPRSLLRLYNERCRFLSTTVSKIDQMIVNNFMQEGYYERHLNKARAMYKVRHDVLLQALKPILSSGRCIVLGEHAGVHLLLEFQDGSKEVELIRLAEQKQIRVYGMSRYYIEERRGTKATILLGYANMSEEEIEVATAQLLQVW
ncbi:MAG: PLP-dependent aminotransferase family protein [Eubacteriales bacterium]